MAVEEYLLNIRPGIVGVKIGLPLDELRAELRAFVAARDWQQFHDPVQIDEADAHSRHPATRERIAAEVADVGIGLLLLCERIGLDFVEVMRAKVKKNAERYPVEGARGRAERP